MPQSGKASKKRRAGRRSKVRYQEGMIRVSGHAAGIDIGSRGQWVCVPYGSCPEDQLVRSFGSFTADLFAIRDWLQECGVTTVAMESTGVYWIPLYQVLEEAGLDVWLVNARYVKRVPGRPKTDRLDCQWIQRLHSYGLLRRSFRPSGDVCAIRSLWRYRDTLIGQYSRTVKQMQSSLHQMNVLLHHVVSDITGETGMAIMQAIVKGERDPERLVRFRDGRVKATPEEIVEALRGDYREEHIAILRMALDQLSFLGRQISELDRDLEQRIRKLPANPTEVAPEDLLQNPTRRNTHKHAPDFDAVHLVQSLYGAPVADIPGMGATVLSGLLTELGLDLSAWDNTKAFTAWLTLSPKAHISGGKVLSAASTAKTGNRAGCYFRQAASSLKHSPVPLGQFYRRMRARKGTKHAITATARKLAVIFYNMVTLGLPYREIDLHEYDEKLRTWRLNRIRRQAAELGFELKEKEVA